VGRNIAVFLVRSISFAPLSHSDQKEAPFKNGEL